MQGFFPRSSKREAALCISLFAKFQTKTSSNHEGLSEFQLDLKFLSTEPGPPYKDVSQNTLDSPYWFVQLLWEDKRELTQHKAEQINMSNGHKVWTQHERPDLVLCMMGLQHFIADTRSPKATATSCWTITNVLLLCKVAELSAKTNGNWLPYSCGLLYHFPSNSKFCWRRSRTQVNQLVKELKGES